MARGVAVGARLGVWDGPAEACFVVFTRMREEGRSVCGVGRGGMAEGLVELWQCGALCTKVFVSPHDNIHIHTHTQIYIYIYIYRVRRVDAGITPHVGRLPIFLSQSLVVLFCDCA